jgi:hypothetical protein
VDQGDEKKFEQFDRRTVWRIFNYARTFSSVCKKEMDQVD